MIKEDIKVSVIIPVYKVEKYLNQCVDSVINQTYKNIEVILVDDGSPDNCPVICDEYAKRDKRIKVVHKTNGGVSSAREAGISAASGDYVMIVDGDDWIDENTVETCVAVLHKHDNLGCIIFSYIKERENRNFVRHVFDTDKSFLSKEEFLKGIYLRLFGLTNSELHKPEGLDYLTSCCMKLYRRDLIACAEYVDTKTVGSGEDGIFNIYALSGCDSAVYIDKPFYHYRANETSITSLYRPSLISQWSCLFGIMQEYIDKKGLSDVYQEALNNRISLGIVGIGLNGLCSPDMSFSKFKKYIDSYIKSDVYETAVKTIKIKCLPVTWKVLLICSKYRMSFFVCVILKAIKYLKSKI